MPRPISPPITREELAAKLMSNVEPCPTTGCWLWTGKLNENGYAKVCHSNSSHLAHREAYKLWKGPIEEGMSIDHMCENSSCINPLHLDKCTRGENCRRERYRRLFCKKGLHLMRGDNILYLKNGARTGWRMCRACAHARDAKWRNERPDLVKSAASRDREKHREKRLAGKKAYYQANRERLCAKQRAYDKQKYWEEKNERLTASISGKG